MKRLFTTMNSLRKKITVSSALFAGLVLMLSLFAFADLLYLESHLDEGQVVTLLKDDVLEMRRHEKNLLLYRNLDEIEQVEKLLAEISDSLQTHIDLYQALLGPELTVLQATLEDYRAEFARLKQFLSQDNQASHTLTPQAFDKVRQLGHEMSERVDELASLERLQLVAMTNRTQWALVIAILVAVLLTLVVGWRLTRAVVTPLKRLENKLTFIAEGRFDYLKVETG